MWQATLKAIVSRRVRLALSAAAVVLAVGFATGTYVLTDTLDHSFSQVFRETVAGVDVVVRLRGEVNREGTRERFPEAITHVVRAVPGVARADPAVYGYAQFVDRHGNNIQYGAASTLGVSWAQPGNHGPLRLVRDGVSRVPRGPHEVAMDVTTARENGFRVGDRVRVLLQGPAQELTIVGLFGFGDLVRPGDLGTVTWAAFDLPTAQEVLGAPGEVDFVYAYARPGVTAQELRARIARAVGPSYEAVLADDAAAETGKVVRDFLDLLTRLLLGFAAIGLLIAALLVVNTFTILVTQRTREIGLLRAVGASRSQVVGSVVGEAAVVGVVSSAIGLGVGVGLAALLLSLVSSIGFHVPEGPLVVHGRTIAVALGAGTLATIVAASWPALRAARIPPVEALTDVTEHREQRSTWRVVLGGVLAVAGVPVLWLGLDRTESSRHAIEHLWIVALGVGLLFGAVVVLLGAWAGTMARWVGGLARRFGTVGLLARENAARNPRRTAATASALVLGLALVGLVAIFADSIKASVGQAIDRGIRADFVIKAQQFTGFSPDVAKRIASLPEVRAVNPLQFRKVRVQGVSETVASVNPGSLARTVDLRMRRGRIANLDTQGVLVESRAARAHGLTVGDTVSMQMARGVFPLHVVGIFDRADFSGLYSVDFVISGDAYRAGFGDDEQDTLVYVLDRGDHATAASELRHALGADFPNVDVFTRGGYRSEQERAIDRYFAVTVALLLLAEVIAVLGIVNTLALSVFERTREVGLLRAIGMTGDQVESVVRGESIIISVMGALIGAVVGILSGWAFTTALEGEGISEFSVPVWQLACFVLVAVLAGVVAAWFPARRAARLDVLAAIAVE